MDKLRLKLNFDSKTAEGPNTSARDTGVNSSEQTGRSRIKCIISKKRSTRAKHPTYKAKLSCDTADGNEHVEPSTLAPKSIVRLKRTYNQNTTSLDPTYSGNSPSESPGEWVLSMDFNSAYFDSHSAVCAVETVPEVVSEDIGTSDDGRRAVADCIAEASAAGDLFMPSIGNLSKPVRNPYGRRGNPSKKFAAHRMYT